MAKLTVYFKYKAIHSELFENGIVHIGRDDTNDLVIDSLAIAPVHAALIIRDDVSTIKQLNEDFPVIVNGEKTKIRNLNNNDMITLGKHDIVYNDIERVDPIPASDNLIDPFDQETHHDNALPPASFQIINGPNIGKLIQLKKAMTRLGHGGSGIVVISKRKDGYFVTVLENIGEMAVNNTPLTDRAIKLNHNDVVSINGTSMQFFLESGKKQGAASIF